MFVIGLCGYYISALCLSVCVWVFWLCQMWRNFLITHWAAQSMFQSRGKMNKVMPDDTHAQTHTENTKKTPSDQLMFKVLFTFRLRIITDSSGTRNPVLSSVAVTPFLIWANMNLKAWTEKGKLHSGQRQPPLCWLQAASYIKVASSSLRSTKESSFHEKKKQQNNKKHLWMCFPAGQTDKTKSGLWHHSKSL